MGALQNNTGGPSCTAVGYNALTANTSGNGNTAVGAQALDALTTANACIGIGQNAGGKITTGGSNVAIGSASLDNLTTGSTNIAIGDTALSSINTGNRNVAIGHTAMANASGASHDNVCIGTQSGYQLSAGNAYYNTCIGSYTLDEATTAHSNTAIGYGSLSALTTGDGNVALGIFTGVSGTTAAGNTLIGNTAGHDITTAAEGVCVGNAAGYSAGNDYVAGTGGIYIGSASQASSSNVDQEIVLAYNQIGKGTRTFHVGADLGVYHAGNISSWSTTSDERIKKNIVDNNVGLDIVNKLQPRNFEYRSLDEIKETTLASVADKAHVKKSGTQLGFIAQELEKVLPNCVTTNEMGIKNVSVDNILYYLINSIKELSTKVTALEAK